MTIATSDTGGLNDLYTPYRLTNDTPWGDAHRMGWFKPLALHNHTYRRHRPFYGAPRELGWLTMAGLSIEADLDKLLTLELTTYRTLAQAAFECAHRQYDWALEVLALPDEDRATLHGTRPKSAAELLQGNSLLLLGLAQPQPLVATMGRYGPLHLVFRVPVNPDTQIEGRHFILDVDKALTLADKAQRLDRFVEELNDGFEQVELKSRKLTHRLKNGGRSLIKINENLNPDLIFAANTELAVGMFYRASALADFLRKTIYQNIV